jgi:hypothetical protein
MVMTGELSADTLVGRWWKDEIVEIDVLGLAESGPTVVGDILAGVR